jgi:hypothetical protein
VGGKILKPRLVRYAFVMGRASHKRKQRRAPSKTSEKHKATNEKTRTWTLPTILGLIIGVLGALGAIELRPQLTVLPQEQLATRQPFSAPFEIANTGYLSVHINNIIVIVHKAEFLTHFTVTDAAIGRTEWDNLDLDRGASTTILARFSDGVPENVDLIVAVDYRFLWRTWRRLFRFVGIHMEKWQWSKQPMGELAPTIDKVVDDALVTHRKMDAIKRAHGK